MNIHAMLTLPFKLIAVLSYMEQGIKVIALEFLIVVDLPDAHFHSVLLEKQRDRVLRTLLLARALNKLLHESPPSQMGSPYFHHH